MPSDRTPSQAEIEAAIPVLREVFQDKGGGRRYSDIAYAALSAAATARPDPGDMERQRNDWIKLFNRLDAAVSRWRNSGGDYDIPTDSDALEAAHDRILKAAASLGEGSGEESQ